MQVISDYHPMHASFLFHQSDLQLVYTAQALIFNLKTCAMQAYIWNAHSNATYKFISLLHLLVCSNLNWSLLSYLSPYVKFSLSCFSPPIFMNYFSPFVINDHKGSILDRLRLSMSINGVMIIFSNLVQSRIFAKYI